MKKLTLPCLILITAALMAPLNCGLAQTRTIGVKAGDTFRYTYTLDLNMDNATQSMMPSVFESVIEEARQMEFAQISVLNVTGTTVTAQTLLHYKNGTEQSSTSTGDIAAGEGNFSMFLVASNLNQNDPIYMGQPDATINETVTKNYPSGSRQVNHQSIVSDFNLTQEDLGGLNITGFIQRNTEDLYWDRQMGVLIEMSYVMVTQSQTFNADISMKVALVESNVLTLPEFPTFMPVLVAVFGSGIAATLYKRKRRNGPL